LRGRLGHDRIHFDMMLNAETDVDMITNFSVVDDFLMVVDGVFSAIGATGFFAASHFAIVAARENAETAHHHVVYEHSAGLAFLRRPRLGGGAKSPFAQMTAGTLLTASYLFVCHARALLRLLAIRHIADT
jgi:Ca2+-binding RTX toxin-like protein